MRLMVRSALLRVRNCASHSASARQTRKISLSYGNVNPDPVVREAHVPNHLEAVCAPRRSLSTRIPRPLGPSATGPRAFLRLSTPCPAPPPTVHSHLPT